ncbi:3-hydroxy-fatty acyl-ACP dehydratase [Siccibacter turicensis]|uniref:ApeP family dehydratase n=1 Tax=Siccibacter turicensis TaxID=357233 RepID=UPI00101FA8F2|nr:3-hydroxy-fatty acyl-ACP dehydratase [Siccibacter turicensis]
MSTYLTPGTYLPHDAPMLLLEQVVYVTNESACCRVRVASEGVLHPFLDADGNLPGWYALELMAQTVGVWSGWHRHQLGKESITLGMVLGARELSVAAGCFPSQITLDICVTLLMQDERFGSFEGEIRAADTLLAKGRVNTFQPSQDELLSLFNQGSSS